jgi:cation transport ATPase
MAQTTKSLDERFACPPAKDANREDDHDHAVSWREINRVFFVAAAAGAIWFAARPPNPYLTAIAVISTLAGGFPIFREAYENITERRMTMELSMTIAIVAALAIREVFTALVIRFLFLLPKFWKG